MKAKIKAAIKYSSQLVQLPAILDLVVTETAKVNTPLHISKL